MTAHHPLASVSSESETNVYSISDAHLAQRYQFIREIGAGNWGCVWLCSPKTDEARAPAQGDGQPRRVAVKLVFREKRPNTAHRVRSLWNEMKIVRALKQDPHPSIIPFHSFIITPSFAIITMEYLPYLIPVEVPELKAREWFHSLLSAVHFLHCRGVVHNDIKPANILLSTRKVPMFVDFGFAEKYELGLKRAFMSNLAYGTPEYLAPERARGHTHDTRKSDMWSLGITFFEILVGRTPFEFVEGEKFATPADLEHYWQRTVRGKWVGSWKMSRGAERLLRRMIYPSVNTRCTAAEAMLDPYWMEDIEMECVSAKNSLMTLSSPVAGKTPGRVKRAPAKPTPDKEDAQHLDSKRSNLLDVKTRSVTRPARRVYPHALPTIQGSPISVRTAGGRENIPPSSLYRSPPAAVPRARPPVRRKPVPTFDENASPFRTKVKELAIQTPTKESKRRSAVLSDATSRMHNIGTPGPKRVLSINPCENSVKKEKGKENATSELVAAAAEKGRQFGSGSYDRVKAFERLKQLERNRFLEEEEQEEEEEEGTRSKQHHQSTREISSQEAQSVQDVNVVQEVVLRPKASSQCMTSTSLGAFSTVTRVEYSGTPTRSIRRPRTADSSSLRTDFKSTLVDRRIFEEVAPIEESKTELVDSLPVSRSRHETNSNPFKQGIKASIDKTFGLYKLSIGRMNTRRAAKYTCDDLDGGISITESWENDIRDAKASLPVLQHPLHPEQDVAENKADRLSQWIRNVEQVVKEAKENFVSSSITVPPPLPAPPVSRAHLVRPARPTRANRKILPADQIFQEPEQIDSPPSVSSSEDKAPPKTPLDTSSVSRLPSKELNYPRSPQRRRATISSGPSLAFMSEVDLLDGTPSKRKEKSKSADNLTGLVRPISPLSQLQKALEKEEQVKPTPNLSELLDRSVFIARPSGSTPPPDAVPTSPASPCPQTQIRLSSSFNPTKPATAPIVLREVTSSSILFTPQRKRESAHDPLASVKLTVRQPRRISKSQISSPTPVQASDVPAAPPPSTQKKTSRLFGPRQGRLSHQKSQSEDLTFFNPTVRKIGSGSDEFGLCPSMSISHSSSFTKDASKSVNAVRKAFKAIVSGKSVTRRQQSNQQQQQQATKVL